MKNLEKSPNKELKSGDKERILLTGTSGAFGQLLARDLCKSFHVIGADRRPFPRKPPELEHHQIDLRRKSAYQLLKKRKPSCIVHVGVIRNPLKHKADGTAYYYNLEMTSQLLKLAEQLKVRKFVFLSTANLYGPSAQSSGFLTEDAPLHGADRSPEIRDLVALDMMIQSFFWKQPKIETVILRPVHIVGKHLNNAPSRYLRREYMPTIWGYDPMIQAVHETDVVRSINLSLKKNIRGIFNIVGKDQAPLSRIIDCIDNNSVALPEILLRSALNQAFRFNLTTYPPGELNHLKYTCLVDGSSAAKGLNFEPHVGLMTTVRSAKKRH